MDIPATIATTITDPKAYAELAPVHEAFKWLRANNPVGRANIKGAAPFWVVSKHADVLDVSRQNDLFHSGDRSIVFSTLADERETRKDSAQRAIIVMDAPDHMKHRTLTQSWFMPGNIRKLEGHLRELSREHIDRMAARGGECDFANDVAVTYPLRVIMKILGVEPEHEPLMLRLTQEIFGVQDAELNRSRKDSSPEERYADRRDAFAELYRFFNGITNERRRQPRDDLSTLISTGLIDGQPLSDMATTGYYTIIATAGHDTTSSSLAGAVWGMCEYPKTLAAVKADPSLIPGMVEEAIRWTTPVKHFMRSATADTELRGRKIAKGDWLFLSYASGNRDEEVFDNPEVFDPTRKPNKQLAFGYGAHMCLGQHLARMELRIFFEELIPRLKSLTLAGNPTRVAGVTVSGPKRLPIRYQWET